MQAFLAAMSTKWSGEDTPIAVSAVVGDDTIDLAATPGSAGPFKLTGAPPPELRDVERFWLERGASDVCEVFASRDAMRRGQPISIAAWSLSFVFVDGDVTVATDAIAEAGHGMQTGDGPVRVSTSGVLPTGLLAATDYYVIRVDANSFKLATSRANALAGTAVNITAAAGGGNHTLARALTVSRDLSEDGLVEWLAQGVSPAEMQSGDVADVETVFP